MSIKETLAENHAYLLVNGSQDWETIPTGAELELFVNDGYLLESARFYDFVYDYLDFEIDETKKKGVITASDWEKGWNIYKIDKHTQIEITVIQDEKPIPPDDPNPIDNKKQGVNNIYLIERETAREIMKKRFLRLNGENHTDLAERIINLINIPFVVDDDYKQGVNNIWLGDYDTELQGVALNTDVLIIPMGSVRVPSVNNDLSDYQNVKINLFLPYAKEIELSPNDVIDKVVRVEYWVNVYDGSALIMVYSNDVLNQTQKVDLGVKVPFNKTETAPNLFNFANEIGYNGINQFYLEVRRFEPIHYKGKFAKGVIDESVLGDVVGFINVDNIDLQVNATITEKNEITNLLRQGVIIND